MPEDASIKVVLGRVQPENNVGPGDAAGDDLVPACGSWQQQIELPQTIPGLGEKVAPAEVAGTEADMSRVPIDAYLARRRRRYQPKHFNSSRVRPRPRSRTAA